MRGVKVWFWVAMLVSVLCFGQNRQLLYDFKEIPQSLLVNPGVQTSERWHIGIPVISGLTFQAATSGATVNDIFANDGVDFTTKVQEHLINALENRDDFSSTSQIDGINVGFRGRKRPDDYYSFGIYGEMDIISYWPKDLAILAFEGNGGDNIGRSFDLGDLNFRGEMVNVFHFGINRKINDDWTLGVRAKLYSSIFQFQSIKNSGSFTTVQGENNIYQSNVQADMLFQSAGVKEIYDIIEEDTFSTTKDLFNLFTNRVFLGGNLGVGFDLGFTHQLNDQLLITGSILDIGFIYNSKDVYNYTVEGNTSVEGVTIILPDDIDDLDNDLWQDLIDDVEADLPHGSNNSSYLSLRPVKAYGSVRYGFGKGGRNFFENCGCLVNEETRSFLDYYQNSVGGQLYMIKRPKGIQAALTGFYQRRFGNTMALKATYTVDKYTFTNIGLGANFQLGPVNFYVLGDNLLSYANLADSHYASLQFGINIISWNGN